MSLTLFKKFIFKKMVVPIIKKVVLFIPNKLIAINKFREINNKNPYDKTIIFNVDLKNSQLNLSNKRSNSKDKIKFYRNLTNTNVFYNKN